MNNLDRDAFEAWGKVRRGRRLMHLRAAKSHFAVEKKAIYGPEKNRHNEISSLLVASTWQVPGYQWALMG